MIAVAVLLAAQSAADPAIITRGEKIFAQNCSVGYCHGMGGAAGHGPRLRGRSLPKDYLFKVTREGIPSSAMPAWKDRLKEEDIRAVVEYVTSLASATESVPAANPMPAGAGPATLPDFNGPPEAARGHALFFDATRDNCGVCHAVGGRGIAIGPDLASLAAKSPAEIMSAIHATRSRHVLTAKLANGEEFPALLAEQNANQVRLYDLTVASPVLRTFLRSDVISMTPNPSWRHSDFVKAYSGSELEQVVTYLRWAGSVK